MLVTLSGIIIDSRLVQCANVSLLILVTPLPIVTDVRLARLKQFPRDERYKHRRAGGSQPALFS
jgi:hypothetical protein